MGNPQADGAATALWYVGPFSAELRPAGLGAGGADSLLVESLWSGISRGTERLVAGGRVPPEEAQRMRAPLQDGQFPFPVKYGYCAVGRVIEGPGDWPGRTIFALHPHQDRFRVPAHFASPLPPGVPPRRGVLAANMETALNALWDSGAGPCDRVVVIGAGVVGLLVAALAAGLPGSEVTVVDLDASRRGVAEALGVRFALPDAVPGDADVVVHASASAAGLATAIAAAGTEASVVELSWYGAGTVAAPLGGSFHSRRLRLVSSQVGLVSPGRRPRWSHGRRLAAALSLLNDARLDALITEEVAFEDLPMAIPRILAPNAQGLTIAVRYS